MDNCKKRLSTKGHEEPRRCSTCRALLRGPSWITAVETAGQSSWHPCRQWQRRLRLVQTLHIQPMPHSSRLARHALHGAAARYGTPCATAIAGRHAPQPWRRLPLHNFSPSSWVALFGVGLVAQPARPRSICPAAAANARRDRPAATPRAAGHLVSTPAAD